MFSTNSSFDMPDATFVSLFVESVLYGMFILLFALAMSVLLGKRKLSANGTKPLLGVSITMFILGTVHVASDLRRAMNAFLYDQDISNLDTVSYMIKSTAYAMQTLVGDGFMIYRVYLVWNGDHRVVIPLIVCLLGGIAAGAGALNSFYAVKTDDALFLINVHNWIVSFFSLTLFTNVTSTLLIAGRIWLINSRAHNSASEVFKRGGLGPAIMIIVESGAIYSFALILLLALYVNNNYAQYILLDAEAQLVGVVFTMIIVRVGMGLATDVTTYSTRAGVGATGGSHCGK
uniref:Uncharacterized protein n=1 Tax=Mycena chlorophos TaxID=658473 RepID=A0ABQ0LLS5_MYCCL|nr:predicted protein [Mycena chlorophos]